MQPSPLLLLLLFSITFLLLPPSSAAHLQKTSLATYIVHVHPPPPEQGGTHRDWHESFLPHPSRRLYSYSHLLSAFAARLTKAELHDIRSHRAFLHAAPSTILRLHTTHTPAFLGLHRDPAGIWAAAGYGKGVIIGLLDTGITPSHPSFADDGMPSPPPRWKGACHLPAPHWCNNKLIGEMAFDSTNSALPLDRNGHGTHTAGIAAGNFVANASILGNAAGTAAGIAPAAHLAVYKVCSDSGGCEDVDIIAGMEQAVNDGVDIISISIGKALTKFYKSSIAIAAFGAASKGVLVSASAGNNGPFPGLVSNAAPWILTVGAGTMDRQIRAVVKLGDGEEFHGESAYQPSSFSGKQFPLVFPYLADDLNASFCLDSAVLRRVRVEGKIVLCWPGYITDIEKGKAVQDAGGAAILVASYAFGSQTFASPHVLPASSVSWRDGYNILLYWASAANPTATIIFKGTSVGFPPAAPSVAAFSSRGPNAASPGVLKPDVFGPGVNVLAAWPQPIGPFPVEPPFNMISGTSMSCSNLAGVAALLRGLHSDWSPAMIKSAIVTTADACDQNGDPILDLWWNEPAGANAMGAGHVNPARAAEPGLVYDAHTGDYVAYLCGLGYTVNQVRAITGDLSNCSKVAREKDLNYPSFAVRLTGPDDPCLVARRTVTSVGAGAASYLVRVARPGGVTVAVAPERLVFGGAGDSRTYTVTFGVNVTEAAALSLPWTAEGSLVWVAEEGGIWVRSPITVTVKSSSGFNFLPSSNVTNFGSSISEKLYLHLGYHVLKSGLNPV